jgi:hypothetical protein
MARTWRTTDMVPRNISDIKLFIFTILILIFIQRTLTREQENSSSTLRFGLWLERLDLALVLDVGYVDPEGKNGQISGIHTKKFVSGHHA